MNKVLAWEWRKNNIAWYWLAFAGTSFLGLLMGISQYTDYRADFEAQGATYLAVWGQSALLPVTLFIPILLGALQAQKMSGEHHGRNIARLKTIGAVNKYVKAVGFHAFIVSLLSALVFGVLQLGGAMFLGFRIADVFSLVPRLFVLAMAMTAWQLVVAGIGVRLSEFSSIVTVVLLASLLGFGMAIAAPPLSVIYPPALLAHASAVRSINNFYATGSIIAAGFIALLWIILGMVFIRIQLKRAKL